MLPATSRRNVPAARPIIRWAGSKRRLLPKLLACVPQAYDRYFEPFAGSACLFLALRPRKAILGDIIEELIHTYSVAREQPGEVATALFRMPRRSSYYYTLRAKVSVDLDPVARAARFIYLNRNCFNGIYRTNRSNRFNVPWGTRTGRNPSLTEFLNWATAFRGAELRCGDFEDCLSDIHKGDFIYLDPPYSCSKRPSSGEYTYDCFGDRDFQRFVELLRHAEKLEAILLLSFADDPRLRDSFPEWHYRSVLARRDVASLAQYRLVESEVIASNKPLPAEL
jgi:DNA adenine methylase